MAYATTSPFTGITTRTFPTATESEIAEAIEKTDKAFHTWKDLPTTDRCEMLRRAATILHVNRRKYAELLTLEMGKLISEAEEEVDIAVGILSEYAEHGPAMLAPTFVPAKNYELTDIMLINEPMGIIFAVEPWNFPIYQVIRVAAPQLLLGNTILLKHASNVPQSALAMQKLFEEASDHEGLLTNIFASHEAAEIIINDPRVRGVALTGSEKAGAIVAGLAARVLKKSTLELGGADAYIVLDDADIPKSAQWAVLGRHYNAGQVCCASKRIIVLDSVYEKFITEYKKETLKLRAGDPMDPRTTLAPLSSQTAVDELQRQVDNAVEAGAHCEIIGAPVPNTGCFFQPLLLTTINPLSAAGQTEFFGPVTQIYRAINEEDAIRIANSSPYGLGGSVCSNDHERAKRIARRLDTGMVYINRPTGVKPDVPFGGTKRSGYGRELTELGLKEFANQKIIVDAHM